jgi:CRISPR-associated protein (TIGR03984 family)
MIETATSAHGQVATCAIEPLSSKDCETWLEWLQGKAPKPSGADGIRWALTYSVDGVTWGRCDKTDHGEVWRLGSDVVPEVSPSLRLDAIEEIRMFGDEAEVLMWRASNGLVGRVLRDLESVCLEDPLRSSEESRILRGDSVRRECENDFTYICDSTGAEQVIPLCVTEDKLRNRKARLVVRNYFEKQTTGAVRVVATRLVKLE